ncbi:cancer/testis antigen 47A-like [Diceros bicornis minor]|uniref:cancer/testis antigen 47A-like n=1 Tax=Diceros bicornis minor TaxID=77932 RepID=UPI0026F1048B|nr:cancer/testis antigen 47A-like [Diceros bicornis minor]
MSATGEGDMTLGGPDSPMGMAGAWARAAGAGDGVGSESGPHGAAGVRGAAGGLGEAAGEQGAAAAEGGSAGEDSDIGPAEEGEEEAGRDLVVDAHLFPMANFRLMFLDLVRSLLHRVYYNDHVLVRPRAGRLLLGRPRPRAPDGAAELHAPQPPPEGAAAPAPAEEATREPPEEATREPAEEATREPAEEAAAAAGGGRLVGAAGARAARPARPGGEAVGPGPQPAEGPVGPIPCHLDGCEEQYAAVAQPLMRAETTRAISEPPVPVGRGGVRGELFSECLVPTSLLFFTKETTKCRYENANEEVEDAESKEEKEKFNRKQEGPEKDLDPAESTLRKSSCEE